MRALVTGSTPSCTEGYTEKPVDQSGCKARKSWLSNALQPVGLDGSSMDCCATSCSPFRWIKQIKVDGRAKMSKMAGWLRMTGNGFRLDCDDVGSEMDLTG
jgi:hypothetical protein